VVVGFGDPPALDLFYTDAASYAANGAVLYIGTEHDF
jgi:hypothetical protein